MKRFATFALCALIALFPSCMQSFSAQDRAAALAKNDQDLAAGRETQAEHDARAVQIAATPNKTSIDWGSIGGTVGVLLAAVVASMTGVRLQRGPVTQTVGLDVSQIRGLPQAMATGYVPPPPSPPVPPAPPVAAVIVPKAPPAPPVPVV